ncbi:hypothetical protein CBS63078_2009 [Aspergillus niger]|nr:hypothetical protein CBS133816_8525 [Aspergillus niger]KAI2864578.1 hypothetical protein CBS12448_2794 [Aspergillus niger]KAI2927904.1 hypothetical protein CBS63078_2009 [Aspergillus niger]KAI3055984.1 hypothetical protein CBS147352_2579 [Aspergillus niger]
MLSRKLRWSNIRPFKIHYPNDCETVFAARVSKILVSIIHYVTSQGGQRGSGEKLAWDQPGGKVEACLHRQTDPYIEDSILFQKQFVFKLSTTFGAYCLSIIIKDSTSLARHCYR